MVVGGVTTSTMGDGVGDQRIAGGFSEVQNRVASPVKEPDRRLLRWTRDTATSMLKVVRRC